MQHKTNLGELRFSRKKSGLSNKDLAHLLGIDPSRASRIECGHIQPRVYELCNLCVIYDQSLCSLFQRTCLQVKKHLAERLATMPNEPANWEKKCEARLTSLELLRRRLEE